jgi:hypothetical protein
VPLYKDGLKKIRRSLELVASKQWSPYEKVGKFTVDQLEAFNAIRIKEGRKPIEEIIVCNGKHLYNSRCVKDGYSIDEVIEQVEIAFEVATQVEKTRGWATTLRNPGTRTDSEGHVIRDEIAFECNENHLRASLYSVIPRGDGRGPGAKR